MFQRILKFLSPRYSVKRAWVFAILYFALLIGLSFITGVPQKLVENKQIIREFTQKGFEYWIIDWKTAQSYGWRREKKQDFSMLAQLVMYKHFWSKKHSIELKDIRCGFILLKRGGKPGRVCELVTVSVGPKSLEKGLKIMNSMVSSVRKGLFFKNRNSCTYCQFKDTEYCT